MPNKNKYSIFALKYNTMNSYFHWGTAAVAANGRTETPSNIKKNSVTLQSDGNAAMTTETAPRLFGQKNSSRDYANAAYWGKNQFNSSFPASLVAYMASKNLSSLYVKTDADNYIKHKHISGEELFGIDPLSESAYYNFEAGFVPYEQFYTGNREKIDLVMIDLQSNKVLRGLEIKLTAVPDNTTKNLAEDLYSSEIVMRPPTICFLACSICANYNTKEGKSRLKDLLSGVPKINHWEEADEVLLAYQNIENAILKVSADMWENQTPLILQPIWKTQGAKMKLAEDCLDSFVWSNLAIIQMCVKEKKPIAGGIDRFQRTIVWIYLMLFDFVMYGNFDYIRIIKNHSYGTANDKAFALPGTRSHKFLSCAELSHPRVSKNEIRNIVLGGGQNLLSPERRFDAVLYNSPELFD